MSCPHSVAPYADPTKCSLCRGAVPRIVKIIHSNVTHTIDGTQFTMTETGVYVDGVRLERGIIPEPRVGVHDTASRKSIGERRCGVCGKLGHMRNKCSKSASTSLSTAGGSIKVDDEEN